MAKYIKKYTPLLSMNQGVPDAAGAEEGPDPNHHLITKPIH